MVKGKYIRTDETKRKMSNSLKKSYKEGKAKGSIGKHWKRKKLNYEQRMKLGKHNKGKIRSEEFKRNLSIKYKGEKCRFWKGGITPINIKIRSSLEYKLWRESVFRRDKFTCIWCGSKIKIEADHIKPFSLFPELRFAIDNGRTLCNECHKKTDTYAGKYKLKETNLLLK